MRERASDFGVELQSLTAFSPPTEENRRSWRLQPSSEERRRRCPPLRNLLCLGAFLCAFFFILAMVKVFHHHNHHKPPFPSNSTIALQKALKFFNAQRSGRLPQNNNISWRGDSALQDGNSPFRHLSGGYYDDGSAVKSSFLTSFSLTMLSWSFIEYPSKYEAAGELSHIKGIIRWGTDYLLNTFNSNDDTITGIVKQIGSDDHNCWMRPENIDYKRKVDLCILDCAYLSAEMSAALASASIVFQEDTIYSQKLRHGAEILYKFSESLQDSDDEDRADELLWGGAWLYYATGNITYLDKVTSPTLSKRLGVSEVFSWKNKLAGAQVLLTRLWLFLDPPFPYANMLGKYHEQTTNVICSFLPFSNKFERTKGGLIYMLPGEPRPLQYAANAAFLAALYGDYLNATSTPQIKCGTHSFDIHHLMDFSRSQIDYILGKNPKNMSYIVGFGEKFPKHVHHRGSSIPMNQKETCTGGWKWEKSKNEDPNTIEGAMVAGPDVNDRYEDNRAADNFTEPSLVANAGLVAALVAASDEGLFDKNNGFSGIGSLFP